MAVGDVHIHLPFATAPPPLNMPHVWLRVWHPHGDGELGFVSCPAHASAFSLKVLQIATITILFYWVLPSLG